MRRIFTIQALLLISIVLTACVRRIPDGRSVPGSPTIESQPIISSPVLIIPEKTPGLAETSTNLPILLDPGGNKIKGVTLSIDFDQELLAFDNADTDKDGLPDSIKPSLPKNYEIVALYDPADQDGELDIEISASGILKSPLPAGTILTLNFLTLAAGEAVVAFSPAQPPTFILSDNQSVSGVTNDGSLVLSVGPISGFPMYMPLVFGGFPALNNISGVVLIDGQPMPGIEITLNGEGSTFTDAQGRYQFRNLPEGEYKLFASLKDYLFVPLQRTVLLPPDAKSQDFKNTLPENIATQPPGVETNPTQTSPIIQPETATLPALSGNCIELVRNGGFEALGQWIIPDLAKDASPTTQYQHSGDFSMRVGILEKWENIAGPSVAYQDIELPAEYSELRLEFWISMVTGEVSTSTSDDRQAVLLLDQENNLLLALMPPMIKQQSEWTRYEYSLNQWAGQAVRLAFHVENDGEGEVTALLVDDVSIKACP